MPETRLETLLQQSIGLSLHTVGPRFIDRSVKSRMLRTGSESLEEYVRKVESDSAELQELIETIIVPETWFFRDPEAFAALGNWAVQDRVARSPGEPLRILSLPCSTGEEAYSIAICLLKAGLAPEQFCVTAMDISERSLSVARKAVYSSHSFRGASQESLRQFFEPAAGGVLLIKTVCGLVTFRQANVLESLAEFAPGEFDVIFCRNLLIYFDRGTQLQTLKSLERVLGGGGLLFVGSAEAYMVRIFGCKALDHPMSFGFHRCGQPAASPQAKQPRPDSPVLRPAVRLSKPAGRPDVRARNRAIPAPTPAAAPVVLLKSDDLLLARQLADQGEFGRARALCEALVSRAGAGTECYLLLALIEDAENHVDRAAGYYRKVLYLDPNHAEALAHMALISDRLGDTQSGARFRRRALRLNSPDGAAESP